VTAPTEHADITAAKALIAEEPTLSTYIADLVRRGEAEWFLDPHVPNVVGCVDTQGDGFAYVVVYLDLSDWEVDEDTEIDLYSID